MYNNKYIHIINKITKHYQNSEFYIPELERNKSGILFKFWGQSERSGLKDSLNALNMLFTVNCTLNQERHLRIPAKVKSLKKRNTYTLIERRRIIAVLCRSPRIKHYFWASAQSYRYNDQVVFKMQSNSISYQFPQSVLLLICGVTLL